MDGRRPESARDAPAFPPPLAAPLAPRRRWWLISPLSLLASLFTSTTLGAGWYLSTRTDVTTDLLPWLGPETIRRVWTDPQLLAVGLRFSLPLMAILLCHELGHFLACRRYSVPATPPVFLPAPLGLGTFGAFIRILAPIRDKRRLLDIGAAGPLAGFVALLPFLLYGVAASRPAVIEPLAAGQPAPLVLLVPGRCLAVELVSRLFHGPLGADQVLDLHPFALAAWVGLLATALNLLPLGQLDGGHILYAALGRWQRRLAWPLWALLALAGLAWRGWLFWALLLLVMGLRHPPVWNERQPLDRRRQLVAWACLALLALSFMPVPLAVVGVAQ